jgi:hypothetical protein
MILIGKQVLPAATKALERGLPLGANPRSPVQLSRPVAWRDTTRPAP